MARAQDWCILRTSGPRTLKVAASLREAGFDAWTPEQTISRRKPRSTKRVETIVPLTPSFVFVRADRLADLALILRLPINPHPPFSLFRHGGRVPVIADREIANLRAMEADAADRAQRAARKAHRQAFTPGQHVQCNEPAFTGLTGVVQSSDGKQAVVLFGGALRMTIASWRLTPDPVQEGNKPAMGLAA